jgi:hypothetical protein
LFRRRARASYWGVRPRLGHNIIQRNTIKIEILDSEELANRIDFNKYKNKILVIQPALGKRMLKSSVLRLIGKKEPFKKLPLSIRRILKEGAANADFT